MRATIFSGMEIHKLIHLLPAEQLDHISHVCKLVSLLTEVFCKQLNCPKATHDIDCAHFGEAAYYHDIGKVLVPLELLTKQGLLTKSELDSIRKHPVYAKKLFKLIRGNVITGMSPSLINLAYDAAVYHHEWWNGQGYPYGVSRENIPLIARITSVCDAYDAMTRNRVYRDARNHSIACQELETSAGNQFDPTLIRVFLDNEKLFRSL